MGGMHSESNGKKTSPSEYLFARRRLFGTFEPQHRAARAGRNPQTGEPIEIAEATLPKFTPGKLFKDRVVEAHKPKPKSKAAATGKAEAKTEKATTGKPKAKPKKV